MLIFPILSPYLSGLWSWTECNNDHVLVVCDRVNGRIQLSGFILAGFMASKNADLLYFGWIISVTVKRLVTSHIISSRYSY